MKTKNYVNIYIAWGFRFHLTRYLHVYTSSVEMYLMIVVLKEIVALKTGKVNVFIYLEIYFSNML